MKENNKTKDKIEVNYLKSMVRLNSFNNGLFDFSVYTLMSAPGKETWFIGGPNLQWYIYHHHQNLINVS